MTKNSATPHTPKNEDVIIYQGGYPVTITTLTDEPPVSDEDTAISASVQETPQSIEEVNLVFTPIPLGITGIRIGDIEEEEPDIQTSCFIKSDINHP